MNTHRLDLTPPQAPRLRRPSWRDPRLVVGIVLVALSVAGGSAAVSAASRTTPVWVATGPLTPGEPLTKASLRIADLHLGTVADKYLLATEALPEGMVITRTVRSGELIARSAIGEPAALDLRSVAVPVTGALSDRVQVGGLVDVWLIPTAPRYDEEAIPPRIVVASVVVEQIDRGGAGLMVGSASTVHVLVPSAALPKLLAALAAAGSISVVPMAGGGF